VADPNSNFSNVADGTSVEMGFLQVLVSSNLVQDWEFLNCLQIRIPAQATGKTAFIFVPDWRVSRICSAHSVLPLECSQIEQ
jgi:hypothetical protein